MKIFCVQKNVKNQNENYPYNLYLKPETAIIKNNQPFYYPDYFSEIEANLNIVIKIIRLGKNISEKYANLYYSEIGIAIDFIPVNFVNNANPYNISLDITRTYDASSTISKFIYLKSEQKYEFELSVNNEIISQINFDDNDVNKIISYISMFYTLKIGDLLFISNVEANKYKIKIGDFLEVKFNDLQLLKCSVK